MKFSEDHKLVKRFRREHPPVRRDDKLNKDRHKNSEDYWLVSLYASVYQSVEGRLPIYSLGEYFNGFFEIEEIRKIVFVHWSDETLDHLEHKYLSE